VKKESISYGVIGLLLGVVLAGSIGSYAVNNNHPGMMGMMGIDSHRVMGGNIDKRFIEAMIPHHESAVAMAKLARQKATHPEIKALADSIIASQSAEIKTMRQWHKDWYGTDVSKQTGITMMGGGMLDSQAEVDSLNAATDFDKAFLEQMIPHHQMAVMMANMLGQGTNRPEMQKLAGDILSAQSKEINQMQTWQTQWGYTSPAQALGSHTMMH